MPIFEVKGDQLVAVAETSFSAEGIYERKHIQALLKAHIEVLDERLMVIAEEFGDWLDSSRRIDLLCLDKGANLVVVELKRTDDGGHMELQAIRYAAMVSAMTFDQLVETLARQREPANPDTDAARADVLNFLGWDEPDEDRFGRDTRIILASADFGKELTTAVLWLIDRGIDIRCVRLKPYRIAAGPVLMDIQQLIPLPETASFQTQIGVKRQAERKERNERQALRLQFWSELLAYAKTRTPLHANRKPSTDGWISGSVGRTGFSISYYCRTDDCQVELWISQGSGAGPKNKEAFRQLVHQRDLIEEAFEGPLEWLELPNADGCRIRAVMPGGFDTPRDGWPELHERLVSAMIRLDKAFRQPVANLKL